MTSASDRSLCPIDLWSEELNLSFWDQIGALQQDASLGVQLQGSTPCYFATRYEDVTSVLRDYRTYSAEDGVAILGGDSRTEPPKNEGRFLPEDVDPPAHTEWRHVINPYLSAVRAARYEDTIVATIDELLRPALQSGGCWVQEDFLRPLQLRVVLKEILHIEGPQFDSWMRWSHDLFVGETAEVAGEAFVSISNAAAELVRQRMASPLDDDVVSAVCGVKQIAGREPTLEERVAVVVPLAIAGTESVGTVTTGLLHHLATHPDDLRQIRADSSLVPAAVEEGLRMFANVTALQRTTTSDTELAGVMLPKGAKVWTSYNAANRDAKMFPNPHSWDLRREEVRHIAFGIGPHRCVGLHHARQMMTTTLRRLLEVVPDFRAAPNQEIQYHSMPTRGIHDFRIEFGPAT